MEKSNNQNSALLGSDAQCLTIYQGCALCNVLFSEGHSLVECMAAVQHLWHQADISKEQARRSRLSLAAGPLLLLLLLLHLLLLLLLNLLLLLLLLFLPLPLLLLLLPLLLPSCSCSSYYSSPCFSPLLLRPLLLLQVL